MASVLTLLLSLTLAAAALWNPEAPMSHARSDICVVDTGGYSYAAGGCVANQTSISQCTEITNLFERYSFASNTWERLPDMPRPRYRYAAEAANSKLYFVGGRTVPDDLLINEVDVFDLVTLTWSSYPQDITAYSDSYAITSGDIIYIAGGYTQDYSAVNATLIINSTLSNVTLVAGQAASMNVARGDVGGGNINGVVYVYGGFTDLDWCNPLGVMEAYYPSNNTWIRKADSAFPRGDMGATVAVNRLWVIGGETKSQCTTSLPVSGVEYYYPVNDSWQTAVDYPFDAFRFSAGTSGNEIFSFGGQNIVDNGSVIISYPVSNAVFSFDTSPYAAAFSLYHSASMLLSTAVIVMGVTITA